VPVLPTRGVRSILIIVLVAAVGLILGAWPGAASPGQTERVSVDSAGNQANSQSTQASISADGRYVAFSSSATNLVPGDKLNFGENIFVHDRQTGETRQVNVASDGTVDNGGANTACFIHSAISGDGRYVAFNSSGTNLVPDDTNDTTDVFVHDLQTGQTTLVSLDEAGNQFTGWSIVSDVSADGRFVVFSAKGGTRLRDLVAGTTERIADGGYGTVSADGRYVAFLSRAKLVPDDTGKKVDIYVRDRDNGTTTRISVGSGGAQGNGDSSWPSISDDGRYVAFDSDASNLVPDDDNGSTDVFVHDRQTGTNTLVSVDLDGKAAVGSKPVISADGRRVAFVSGRDLLQEGTDGVAHIFVRDLDSGTTARASANSYGEAANGDSPGITWGPQAISGDGRYVAFPSLATNLVPDDTNGDCDIFVHDLESPTLTPTPTPTSTPTPVPSPSPSPSPTPTQTIPSPLVSELPPGGGSPPSGPSHAEPLLIGGLSVIAASGLAWLLSRRRSRRSF
jgi:Tol biopolymer transport system component